MTAGRDLRIRPAEEDDLEAVAALSTRANPDDPPFTVEVLRWVLSRAIPERPHAHLVAEVGGDIVGWAILRGIPDVPFLVLWLDVDPGHRRQGIGSALLDTILLRTGGESEVHVPNVSAALPDSVGFLEHRAFMELTRVYESTLDLATFDPSVYDELTAKLVAGGYRFTSLADVDSPRVRRALHRLNNAARMDIPTKVPIQSLTYAEWERDWIQAPHALPAAFAIALWHDRPVAFSYIVSQAEGVGYMWMTAVAREHRSKGLGLAIKVHALRASAPLGLAEVMTNNDPENAPMLAINRRLGFQDRPARIDFRKRLHA